MLLVKLKTATLSSSLLLNYLKNDLLCCFLLVPDFPTYSPIFLNHFTHFRVPNPCNCDVKVSF